MGTQLQLLHQFLVFHHLLLTNVLRKFQEIAEDNKIEVLPDDLRNFAKQQLFSYMGGQLGALGDKQQWVDDYANRMMKDKKFVEESYHRISTEKMFNNLDGQISAKEEAISADDFANKLHHHHH